MPHNGFPCDELPDKIKEEMKKETRESNIDNKEHGFSICLREIINLDSNKKI